MIVVLPACTGQRLSVGIDMGDARTVRITRAGGTPISPFAFGQNYWNWVDWVHDGVTGLTGTEPAVRALGLNVLRAGGMSNDLNGPPPAEFGFAQIDAFVAYCRAVGAEPILQVPVVAAADGGAATAQNAADMVTYANVTRGYGIKYWEIGNNPDESSIIYDAGVAHSAVDFCTVYRTYATAMRAANAAAAGGGVPMTFLGPELAFAYAPEISDWLTPFLDGCRDDVDIVSIHRYPFSGAATGGITPLSVSRALDDVTSFRATVASVTAIVAAHGRPGTPVAITEANVSFDFDPSAYPAAPALAEPTTFYAGLWTADVLGAALEGNLWTLAFWDLGDRSSAPSVLGFLQDGRPVPAYHALQLISTTFRGSAVVPAGVPTGFSAYASYDANAGSTSVLVINKTDGAGHFALAVDTIAAQAFDFPPLSLTLVQIPDAAEAPMRVRQYTQDQADAGSGPVVIR